MACWNAQGLLAADASRQQTRIKRAAKLILNRDMLVLTETHGNEGKCRARRLPHGVRAFWCDGLEGEAGVGIWVKESFIEQVIGKKGGHDWVKVVPGRAAVLRLWGPDGCLQIGMVYLQTGNSGGREARSKTLRSLAQELDKGGKTLTVLIGDLNFVTDKRDRVNGDPLQHTGGRDKGEAEDLHDLLGRLGLAELEQAEFTYRFEDCRSRIDRMYTNMGRYEWMDRDIGCVALDWDDITSRHRPIAGFKRSRAEELNSRPIQLDEVGGEEWSRRIQIEFLQRLRDGDGWASGVERMLLVKEAVWKVTRQIAKEKTMAPLSC